MKRGTHASVTVEIASSAVHLYDVVSDVPRMGEWSPECRRCVWLDGATAAAAGVRFKGSNQRGLVRWSTKPRVVVADGGREFAFITSHLGHDMTRWSFEFAPASDTARTVVTETFEILRDMPWYLRLADRRLMGIRDRKADLEANMTQTLGRLKVAVEEAPAPR